MNTSGETGVAAASTAHGTDDAEKSGAEQREQAEPKKLRQVDHAVLHVVAGRTTLVGMAASQLGTTLLSPAHSGTLVTQLHR
jgi:hypothetical protein